MASGRKQISQLDIWAIYGPLMGMGQGLTDTEISTYGQQHTSKEDQINLPFHLTQNSATAKKKTSPPGYISRVKITWQ